MRRTSLFTSQFMLLPSGTTFRGSDLQRRYRAVLDSARSAPVELIDSDGHRLAVADWDELSFAWTFLRAVDAIAQFHDAWHQHGDQAPANWVSMTPFPFLSVFDRDEVAQFSQELLPSLEQAVRGRNLDPFIGNLRAWESSAETYDDQVILDEMSEPLDPATFVEIPHPDTE